ncbi:MAG: type transport system permease protein [Kosmotogales bacterium]|nr:type transport system permease protein [Kosmotogales bacterium]
MEVCCYLKKVFSLIKNDLKLFFSSRGFIILIILLPFVLTLVCSLTTSIDPYTNLKIAFVNEDKSLFGIFFIKYAASMFKGDNIFIYNSREELDENMSSLDSGFIIPEGFANKILFQKPSELIFIPNPRSLQTSIAIYQVLSNVLKEFKALPVIADPEFMNGVEIDPNYVAPILKVEGTDESYLNFSYFMFPIILSIFLMLTAIVGLSSSIHEEVQRDFLKIYVIAGINSFKYLLSKFISYFLILTLNMSIFILFGYFSNLIVKTDIFAFFIMTIFSIIFYISLGIFITVLSGTVRSSQFFGVAIGVILIILSGVIIPASMFPDLLRVFTAYFPTTKLLEYFQGVVITGYTFNDISPIIAEVSLYSIGLFSLSILFFKRFFKFEN